MIPFTIAVKRIKYQYLGINLTKEVKQSVNYQTLMREVEDTNKWKDILCS